MINFLSFPYITFSSLHFSSSKAFKMVLRRTFFGFQRSYKEGFGFKYQNIVFVLKLSRALLHTQTEALLHQLRMVCIHLKRGYKKKSSCLMKELETNLGVI
jgi:hypothetical protein